MNQGSRSTRSRTSNKRLSTIAIVARLGVMGVVVTLLGLAGYLLYRSLTASGDPTAVAFDLQVSAGLNPLEAASLRAYLQSNNDRLYTPASSETIQTVFEVEPGQTAAGIAADLRGAGLITDETLFINYLRYYGLDRQLEAGVYALSPSMTIPDIAVTLTDAGLQQVSVRITEGWRREQTADWIDGQATIPFSGADYMAATGAQGPAAVLLVEAGVLPPGLSAEGFLFPDTYSLDLNATAEDLAVRMAQNFLTRVTPEMRADAAAGGFGLYEAVTLASIVEREAVVPDERGLIASVYLNRLAADMLLQADPTVQYAQGLQNGSWWNLNLTQADYTAVDSPYNTYLYEGLPPGPIASPGFASIEAVIYPAESPYFFFRATCDDSGRHNFAVTFDEHLANACP
ncbi:MAG: endolytic transglycosylase MltG [Chloroflexi bacterium]|nr:endolytic transglycosylase MltG [Chloroflexota bacterium]